MKEKKIMIIVIINRITLSAETLEIEEIEKKVKWTKETGGKIARERESARENDRHSQIITQHTHANLHCESFSSNNNKSILLCFQFAKGDRIYGEHLR